MATDAPPGVGVGEVVSRIDPPAVTATYMQKKDTDGRVAIALVLVVAYIVLLLANVALPFLLMRLDPTPNGDALAAMKDLSAPLAAGVTSLTGVLGFVLGYYFKAEESKRQ